MYKKTIRQHWIALTIVGFITALFAVLWVLNLGFSETGKVTVIDAFLNLRLLGLTVSIILFIRLFVYLLEIQSVLADMGKPIPITGEFPQYFILQSSSFDHTKTVDSRDYHLLMWPTNAATTNWLHRNDNDNPILFSHPRANIRNIKSLTYGATMIAELEKVGPGKDGNPAEVVILYAPRPKMTNRQLQKQKEEDVKVLADAIKDPKGDNTS